VSYIGRGGKVLGGAPLDPAGEEIDLALLTTKAYDTQEAIEVSAPLLGKAPVVSLQNGLSSVGAIAGAVGDVRTLGGSTTHAARRLPSGEIETVALGETVIAPHVDIVGRRTARMGELARSVAALLRTHGLPTRAEEDLDRLLWRKLVVSCGINAVTAIERCVNGELLRRPAALARAIEAAEEARETGIAQRIDLEDLDAERALRDVCERTAGNRSSMLQDIEAGRPTEVHEINGAVIERAKRSWLRTSPANQALLDEIITLEARALRSRAEPETLTPHGR
jgi:2-dehydropantoate 2-reductase